MASKPNYKAILKTLSRMKSDAASALHERATLLVEVFDDRDFRSDLGNVDDFKAAKVLDEYVDDTPYTFLALRTMLAKYPVADTWATQPLGELYHEAHAREPAEATKRTRTVATKKEVEELATAKKAAEGRARYLETQLTEERRSREELIEENRALRRELHIAHGRITELEKIVAREMALV